MLLQEHPLKLTNQDEKDIDILKTIYEEVVKIGNGRYALQTGQKLGMTDKYLDITVDATYKQAIFRDNYAVFYGSVNQKSKLIIFANKAEIEINEKDSGRAVLSSVVEHVAFDFKLIEVEEADNIGQMAVYDTETGKRLMEYNNLDEISLRPFNNDIILSVMPKDSTETYCLTGDYDYGEIDEILRKLYKSVEVRKGRQRGYICVTEDEEVIYLDEFGQRY